jgi:hypothetical protein
LRFSGTFEVTTVCCRVKSCRPSIAVLAIFGAVASSARAEDRLPPQIVHEPCEFYKKGQAFEIQARFLDESKLFDPKVIYRGRNETFWKNVPFVKQATSEDFSATIKARDLTGTLEYFIEVFDEWGNGPARYGGPEAPVLVQPSRDPPTCRQIPVIESKVETTPASTVAGAAATAAPGSTPLSPGKSETLPVAAPTPAGPLAAPAPAAAQSTCGRRDRPFFCEAWFWGVTGGVVVAAAVGVYFLTRTSSPGTNEFVTLRVTGPGPTGIGPAVFFARGNR